MKEKFLNLGKEIELYLIQLPHLFSLYTKLIYLKKKQLNSTVILISQQSYKII